MFASLLSVSIFELAIMILVPIGVIALIIWLAAKLIGKEVAKSVQGSPANPRQDTDRPQ